MNLIYLVGPPGVGKSTLMRELTRRCDKVARYAATVPHDALVNPRTADTVGLELGRARGAFSGTDALSMSIAPTARGWIKCQPHSLVLGEGDRLAIASFLTAAADSGYAVHLIYLYALDDVLDERCRQRGSAQSRSWRAGRTTKAANLVNWAIGQRHGVTELDGSEYSPGELAALARRYVPALKELP